ncbi:MAG TPA: DUF5995 family protein [Streptomyces sp.]|jgi:hypothetical protein|nr:DUF5995 family protein [Streptomyces sp.]
MTSAQQAGPQAAVAARVADVVGRMHALADRLPEDDGVAVFNRMYLSVTEELRRRLATDWFLHAPVTGELGALFAGRYLAAVAAADGGGDVPACWRPLFALRRHPGVTPLQFALAGINAHVGHDLPLALVDTCRLLGVGPRVLEPDFSRVGMLLCGMEERIREELMPGPDVLDVADPLTHLVGSWSLEAARAGAWAAFRALWGLRTLPEVAGEFAERLDAAVGMAGRCLLTPLP